MATVYDEVSSDVSSLFEKTLSDTSIPTFIKFKLVSNINMRGVAKINKAGPILKYLSGNDIVIILNEFILEQLEDDQRRIVMEEMLSQVYYDMDKDKLKLIKPDLSTFSGIISKYGMDKYMAVKESISSIFNELSSK